MSRLRKLTLASLWMLTALIFAVGLGVPINVPLARWEQPEGVDYQSNQPYVVHVVDESSWWNVPNRNRHCSVRVIAKMQGGPNGYGHYSYYSFHNYLSDNAYIQQSTLDWTAEGVAIIEPSGHKLFVPKAAFVGGR